MQDGATPLLIAAQKGHLMVLERFLGAGAVVDATTTSRSVGAPRRHRANVVRKKAAQMNCAVR